MFPKSSQITAFVSRVTFKVPELDCFFQLFTVSSNIFQPHSSVSKCHYGGGETPPQTPPHYLYEQLHFSARASPSTPKWSCLGGGFSPLPPLYTPASWLDYSLRSVNLGYAQWNFLRKCLFFL